MANNITSKIVALFMVFTLVGCGHSIINYTPSKNMTMKDAADTVEELIMTQHREWKPDSIEINDKYVAWNYGSFSKGSGVASSYSNVIAVGTSSTTTRNVGERIYYSSINKIQLMSYQRKLTEWYVVSIIGKDGEVKKHILYTLDINEAKRFIDAFESLILASKR